MSTVQNPFFHRGAIRDPAYFYNRTRETDQVATLIRTSQSVSVIGPRRIGKTSFLYHLQDASVRAQYGLSSPEHVFVPLDIEGMEGASVAEIYALFSNRLREAAPDLAGEPEATAASASYRNLDHLVRLVHRRGDKITFLIDEFELLAANPNLDPSFFSALRGLATRYALSYVIVSQQPLISLVYADNSVLSSPFFNIFAVVPLGLFSEQESRRMVLDLLSRTSVQFPEEALQAIIELAGPHPFFVQIAAYLVYEALQSGAWDASTASWLAARFYEQAQPHYLYYWNNLTELERYVLANLVVMREDRGAQESLYRLRQQCLIRQVEGSLRYLSASLERFVREQQVPGLLQVAPFVIDLKNYQVTVEGTPLQLTKTQFQILAYLAQRDGQVATSQEIERNVWHDEYVENPERLKAAIKYLRRALGPWAGCIVNERGVGYALRMERQ